MADYAVMPVSDYADACDAVREKTNSTDVIKSGELAAKIRTISAANPTVEYEQMNPVVGSFLKNVTYNPSDYSTSQIDSYANQSTSYPKNKPSGVGVELPSGTLVLTDRYSRQTMEQEAANGENTLYNIIPGDKGAVYTVVSGGDVAQSGRIVSTGQVRMINCQTANVRDLGGWACDGGTVKYGKLFRGGEFQSADLDIFLNQLGIRHELNLRGTTEAAEAPTILRNYVRFTCPEQYVWYTIQDAYKETWAEILRCVFDAAKNNDPVFFHCSAGADRTGTVACIIEAILGMSQSDIDKDYELTNFHTGVSTDNNARRRNEGEWKGLINQINALAKGTTFRDKVVNWVAKLGFTVDEINAFRRAVIDGNPADVTLIAETFTVTNTLTNASTSNSATTVTEGQAYTATITAKNGYTLEGATVSVKMGGVDITATAYANGVVSIANVSGNIVITVATVEIPVPTVPVTWHNGKSCTYAVGSACTVSDNASYIISEEIPVEYGKTYSFEWYCPTTSSSFRMIGINDSGVVTEVAQFGPTSPGKTHPVTYEPTVATTTKMRIRGYSSAADTFTPITELKVS